MLNTNGESCAGGLSSHSVAQKSECAGTQAINVAPDRLQMWNMSITEWRPFVDTDVTALLAIALFMLDKVVRRRPGLTYSQSIHHVYVFVVDRERCGSLHLLLRPTYS